MRFCSRSAGKDFLPGFFLDLPSGSLSVLAMMMLAGAKGGVVEKDNLLTVTECRFPANRFHSFSLFFFSDLSLFQSVQKTYFQSVSVYSCTSSPTEPGRPVAAGRPVCADIADYRYFKKYPYVHVSSMYLPNTGILPPVPKSYPRPHAVHMVLVD